MYVLGLPEQFTHKVHQRQDGMMARVMENMARSKAFAVNTLMKQGCALTPSLLSLMLPVLLLDAYRDEHPGVSIVYRNDNHILIIQ
ncbi:unnamed protein product [Schistocephalus solidus]|uniref:Reverse transcriptase domain-containing protein n=1 Tax=Schistocephalus solidus TaxID=70667 RepID=A0A183S869_SCHSO|nr:unnamed protein product [Schistocephalus solidus]